MVHVEQRRAWTRAGARRDGSDGHGPTRCHLTGSGSAVDVTAPQRLPPLCPPGGRRRLCADRKPARTSLRAQRATVTAAVPLRCRSASAGRSARGVRQPTGYAPRPRPPAGPYRRAPAHGARAPPSRRNSGHEPGTRRSSPDEPRPVGQAGVPRGTPVLPAHPPPEGPRSCARGPATAAKGPSRGTPSPFRAPAVHTQEGRRTSPKARRAPSLPSRAAGAGRRSGTRRRRETRPSDRLVRRRGSPVHRPR